MARLPKLAKLIAAVAICEAAGLAGSVFTMASVTTWYATLIKPSFNPPNWIFGPVWAALYLLMGISLFMVWQKKAKGKKGAIAAFGVQLALNILWSALFFGLRSPMLAFICIIALWISILATMMLFYRISKAAAGLLLPYLLWVSFAALLNLSVAMLNA